jgi:D-psicose/D-tagatose/L-ribulose 3-epimerase
MNYKIGIHLSYWQEAWGDDLVPLVAKANEAGFDVAEFPLLDPTGLDYPGIKSALSDHDMLASCGTGLGPNTDITHPDETIRQAGLTHLRACLEGAASLGSPALGGVTYAPWAVFPTDDLSQRKNYCIRSLKKAAKIAEDLNVVLCMEVLNRFEGYLINTVEQGIEIIEEVGSDWLKLHLDTFHLNIEADDIGEEIRQAGNYLGHFHCVANNRKIPGAGHIPWDQVKEALRDVGYKGYLVAESFVNPAGEVGRGLFIWRKLADEIDSAAKQAAEFLRDEFCHD